jgi:hypothetical protein
VDALYSSQRIEHRIGTLLLAVAGLADTSRVIVVVCDRVGKAEVTGSNPVSPTT